MKKSDEKVVIYQTKDGVTSIEVKLEGETVWLSQHQLSELFQTDRTSILRHIKNIYTTEELDEKSTCAFFAQVREEGHRIVNRRIPYYNLDMIISVGYDGSKRISNGSLVTLTLMIAERRPEEKDIMVKVVVNLINRDN